ncbi:hypothetical protein ACFLZZ_04330 [Nanoarchaeota archaeon]
MGRLAFDYRTKFLFVIISSLLILLALILWGETDYLVRYFTTVVTLLLFLFVDWKWDINYRRRHYAYVLIMAIGGIIMTPLYFVYAWYDKALHLIFPFFLFFLVHYLVSKYTKSFRERIIISVIATFALTVLFEVGEYVVDLLFGWKLRGVFIRNFQSTQEYDVFLGRTIDTILDLIYNIFSIFVGVFTIYFAPKRSKFI